MTFATSSELATFTGDDDLDGTRGEMLLDQASAIIRNYCRQTFDLVEDDEVELRGTWSHKLKLPQRPVVSVDSVSIEGTGVSAFRLVRDTLHRTADVVDTFDFGPRIGRGWGGPTRTVTVTYTHGFETVPTEVKGVCLQVAARAAGNPQSLQSFSDGAVSVTFGGGGTGSQVLGLTASEQSILDRFRHEYAS